MNPSYYGLEDTENESVNKLLSGLVEDAITQLERSACVEIGEVKTGLLCLYGHKRTDIALVTHVFLFPFGLGIAFALCFVLLTMDNLEGKRIT